MAEKTFLEKQTEEIKLRLTQIEEEKTAAEETLKRIVREELTLGKLLAVLEEAPAVEQAVAPQPVEAPPKPKPKPEAKRPAKPSKQEEKKPSPKTRPVTASPEAMDKVWRELRKFPRGAIVSELLPKVEISDTYLTYALKQLEEAKRVTREQITRERDDGRSMKVNLWKIVPPQVREGTPPDPTTKPRGPRPEDIARHNAPPLPRRGAPVPGTGRGRVVLPQHGDTAKIVLEAVKVGWRTIPDGSGHILVVRDEQRDEKTGEVKVKPARVRVSTTPNAPALDRIRKEFKEHGVVFNE